MSLPINILEAIACLDLLAVGLIVPLVPIHIRKLGASYIHVGLLGTMYAGAQLFSGPLLGSMSDLRGRKSILIKTLIVSGVAYSLKGFTTSFYVIIFLRVVLGIFKQTQMLTRALVADYETDVLKQGEIYGQINAIAGMGMTVGPLLAGHIAEDYPETGFQIAAISVGLVFLINTGLVSLLPDIPKPRRRCKKKLATDPDENSGLPQIFSNNMKQSFKDLWSLDWFNFWDVFLFKGLIGFAMGVYYSNYASHLREYFHLTPKYIGCIISFQSIVGSFSSYFMGYINSFYSHDDDFSQRNFHVFVMLAIALLGIVSSYNIYTYVFCLIPLAIGNAMGRLITLEMVLSRSSAQHRGKLIGASNSVRSLTGVVSPMVAGLIAEMYGVQYVVIASFISTMVGVVLSYRSISQKLKND